MRKSALLAGLIVCLFAGQAFARGWNSRGWVLLGENTVDGRRDTDTIEMGRGTGRYSRLMIVVRDADVVLRDFTITFMDDETYSPNDRMFFKEDTRSFPIDLPGDARRIRSISYTAKDLRSRGRATVQVWGEQSRRGHGR